MQDDDKISKVLQELSELRTEMKHMANRLDSKSEDVKKINIVLPEMRSDIGYLQSQVLSLITSIEEMKVRLRQVETSLAVNNQKTNKLDKWGQSILYFAMTLLLGFIAMKVGLTKEVW